MPLVAFARANRNEDCVRVNLPTLIGKNKKGEHGRVGAKIGGEQGAAG